MSAATPRRSHIRRLKVQMRAIFLLADTRPSFLLSLIARLPSYCLRNASEPCFVARKLDLRGRRWRTVGFVVAADSGASMSGTADDGAHARRPVDHLL
jgi:hypothetical protein